jgi:propanol-preferring alcohol dehydrogenase
MKSLRGEHSNKECRTSEPIIPKFCKAGVVSNLGPDFKVTIEDVPVPEPGIFTNESLNSMPILYLTSSTGPDEILIRLNASGICFTDIHYMQADLPIPKMSDFGVRSPGHEGAGVVVKVGSGVKSWKIGDRAGVKPIWSACMNCELCWDGHETYCEKLKSSGLMVTGAYQQYVVSPANYTSRIPDGVNDFIAGPTMCSGATTYSSVSICFF